MKDYYKILGVSRTATQDEIKKAYRKLARRHHPDKWVNESQDEQHQAEVDFKEVEEAYRVLKDSDSRAHYDETGQGKAPKVKDVAINKLASAFQTHIKAGIERELALDVHNIPHGFLQSIQPSYNDDVVKNVRNDLRTAVDRLEQEIKSLTKAVDKLEKAKRKVITKEGVENMYVAVIEQHLEATTGAAAQKGMELAAVEMALNMLNDYEYVGEVSGMISNGGFV